MFIRQNFQAASPARASTRTIVLPTITRTSRNGWASALLLAGAVGFAACSSEPLAPALATTSTTSSVTAVAAPPAMLVLANVNAPAGYTTLADNRFDIKPPWPRANTGTVGSWWSNAPTNPNLTLMSDASAPVSASSVIRTKFYAGQNAGVAPVNMGGWIGPATMNYRKVYFSMWIKIEGTSFENQKTLTKAGFFGVGNPKSGQSELFFGLDNGLAVQRMQSDFEVKFLQQNILQPNGWTSRNLNQNVSRTHLMTAGSWHHWEATMAVNSMGSANGTFQMWIDGTQTHNYSNVVYITPTAPYGFNSWKWNPTWGGSGGVRTRNDYIDIDQVFISGTP
jgi:hypothetical protein